MATSQVEDLLTQAAHLGCLEVRFTGGEPLLRPDFEELYSFARRLGIKVILFTNGRLLTPHLADTLASTPPQLPIEITVYGMHAASYEAVSRRPSSFAQFRRGAALLLEHGVPFSVKGAVLPPNRHEIEELEEWAATLPSMDGPPGHSMFFSLRDRRDDDAKNELIRSVRLTPQDGVAILSRDEDGYRTRLAEFALRFMGPQGARLFSCGAGKRICIDAYGYAQPCMSMRAPEHTIDLAHAPLADAIERFEGLSQLKASNADYLRRCARCFLKGLCEQCPARSWSEHGTLDTPVEYLCDVAHEQARFLGWLGPTERAWDVVAWRERVGQGTPNAIAGARASTHPATDCVH